MVGRRDRRESVEGQSEVDIARIKQGLADLDAGRAIDHAEIKAWLETWGTHYEGATPPMERRRRLQ